MTAVILDDELYCAEALYHLLRKHSPHLIDVRMMTDPEEALSVVRQSPPDVIFLDVEMPFMTGFDFLHALGPTSASIIFTTAYDQYAIQAFKVNAVDYLLKPIDIEELKMAVKKAMPDNKQDEDQYKIQNLLTNLKNPNEDPVLLVSTSEAVEFVRIRDIIRCEADGKEHAELLIGEITSETLLVPLDQVAFAGGHVHAVEVEMPLVAPVVPDQQL